MSSSFLFLNITIFVEAPASINAFSTSYSQLVPGNTGIKEYERAKKSEGVKAKLQPYPFPTIS